MLKGDVRNDIPKFEYLGDVINITGKSIPEDAQEVWLSFIMVMRAELRRRKRLTLNFNLDIFNTSSSIYLNNLFSTLEEYAIKDCKIIVNWYYFEKDEDMFELGDIYKERFKLNFNLIVKK